jgi:hypothetical protein
LNNKIKNYKNFDIKAKEKKMWMKSQEANKIYKPSKKIKKSGDQIREMKNLRRKLKRLSNLN